MTDAPFTVPDPGRWRVSLRYVPPERPELPPLRVAAPPDLPFLSAPSGDDPVATVLAAIVFVICLPFLLCLVLIWVPLWTAKFCWFLFRVTLAACIHLCGFIAALLLPWPWDVVARHRDTGEVQGVRVAGWPTALVERHRLAARLSLRESRPSGS